MVGVRKPRGDQADIIAVETGLLGNVLAHPAASTLFAQNPAELVLKCAHSSDFRKENITSANRPCCSYHSVSILPLTCFHWFSRVSA